MLEKQGWMKYAPVMMTEWRQMMEEGKDVEHFRELCAQTQILSENKDCEDMAAALYRLMEQAPVRAAYRYHEPSSYQEIRQAAKGAAKSDWREKLEEADLKDRITGAWVGRISGCLLGKPLEGLRKDRIAEILTDSGNDPLERYIDSRQMTPEVAEKADQDPYAPWRKLWIDRIGEAAPADDDTNYTVLALKLLEEYGPDFSSNDVLEAWLTWLPLFATCTAERTAYRNAAAGMYAPCTAVCRNPYREWIGAQIRGDFFGYINPGDPEQAARMAFQDGAVSHTKNGIYGEMFVAAMIAQAAVCDVPEQIIQTGLGVFPPASRLAEGVGNVLKWHRDGISQADAFQKIHTLYDEYCQHDWCHVIPNAMIVAASLLYGKKNFGRSICMAVQTGFDTDCNGATVGSVIGMMTGDSQIPKYWGDCFHRKLLTNIQGAESITVEKLAERTLKLCLK